LSFAATALIFWAAPLRSVIFGVRPGLPPAAKVVCPSRADHWRGARQPSCPYPAVWSQIESTYPSAICGEPGDGQPSLLVRHRSSAERRWVEGAQAQSTSDYFVRRRYSDCSGELPECFSCWSANNEAALKARRWPLRTNLWRKRTDPRTGSERRSDISLKVMCEKQRTSTFSHHRRVKRLNSIRSAN